MSEYESMIETSSNVKEYLKQYEITINSSGVNYKEEFDKLFNIFAKLKYNEYIGICDKECKKEMLLQPIDNGWAAVCECSESYSLKTYQQIII